MPIKYLSVSFWFYPYIVSWKLIKLNFIKKTKKVTSNLLKLIQWQGRYKWKGRYKIKKEFSWRLVILVLSGILESIDLVHSSIIIIISFNWQKFVSVRTLTVFINQLFVSVTVPVRGDVEMINHEPVFAAIIKKPFASLSVPEIQFFLTYKESQYAIRRQRIENYCSLRDENFGRRIIKNSLIFDTGKLQSLDRNRIHGIHYLDFTEPVVLQLIILKAVKVDKISYCQIAKVASSSWCNHFIKLGKVGWWNNEGVDIVG